MAQQEFLKSREEALSWIRTVQRRLKVTDNTHGPRHALEARLRETEVRPFFQRVLVWAWHHTPSHLDYHFQTELGYSLISTHRCQVQIPIPKVWRGSSGSSD